MKQFQRVLINTVKVVDIMLTVIFALIAPLLFFSARWMFQTWNHLTMDELIFHLNSPLDGTNTDMIKEYLMKCLVPSIVILLAVIILLIIVRKKKVFYVTKGFLLVGMIALAFGTVILTADRLELKEYLANQGKASDFIDTHYVDPAETSITFPNKSVT